MPERIDVLYIEDEEYVIGCPFCKIGKIAIAAKRKVETAITAEGVWGESIIPDIDHQCVCSYCQKEIFPVVMYRIRQLAKVKADWRVLYLEEDVLREV